LLESIASSNLSWAPNCAFLLTIVSIASSYGSSCFICEDSDGWWFWLSLSQASIFKTSSFFFGKFFFIWIFFLASIYCHAIYKLGVNLVEKLQVVLGEKSEVDKTFFWWRFVQWDNILDFLLVLIYNLFCHLPFRFWLPDTFFHSEGVEKLKKK